MSAADQPTLRAQGDLAKTPFAHLVVYLHREGSSGTLVIDRGGYETKVLFRNGRAVAARPVPRGAALQDGLLELCVLAEGAYAFWDNDLVGEGSGVIRGSVDAFMFVAESLRSHVRDGVLGSVVERYRKVHLSLHPEADLKRLGLRGLEARTAEQLRGQPMLGDDFIERSDLPAAEARKLLYLLVITKQALPVGDSSGTSGVRSAVSDPPPFGAAPSVLPRAASSVPPRTQSGRPSSPSVPYSHTPGSGSSQPPPSGRPSAAPPSGPPAPSLPPRPSAVPGRSSLPAWQQLASRRPGSLTPQSTPAPPPAVPTPSMAPPPVETLDDTGKLRRAEQLAERRNFLEAGRITDDLIARDPKNADYHALRAFIYYQQFTGDRPPRPLLDAIERALRLNEEQARALYVKGLVFKRIGKQPESMRYFQKALEADPQHLEAQRELRLAKMRRDR